AMGNGGHQSASTVRTLTNGQPTVILTFPVAVGAVALITFTGVLKAVNATDLYVRSKKCSVVAARSPADVGGADANSSEDLPVLCGDGPLEVQWTVDIAGPTAGVVSVRIIPTVASGTPTAMTLQCVFDQLP